jgi:DNA-binding CsgD family transcriptional regulator
MQKSIKTDESAFLEKLQDLEKIIDKIPGAVIIHELESLTVRYMCPWAIRKLGVNPEQVINATVDEYFEKYFNPEDARSNLDKLASFIEKGDEDDIITYFQQVRTTERDGWSWYLSTSKIFMKDENGKPSHLITVSSPVNSLQHITSKIDRLLDEKNFIWKNQKAFFELTKREKEILKHMALGKNSLEIGKLLFISEQTVETHRKHIRKKIKANNHYDVVQFAQSFDLI